MDVAAASLIDVVAAAAASLIDVAVAAALAARQSRGNGVDEAAAASLTSRPWKPIS
jgi:hypothetical protein